MKRPFHIVVADDDDDDQFIIKEAVKEITDNEVVITSVYDGLQLFDCLNKKGLFAEYPGNPDLIILDMNMPLMNGMEVLDQLRKDPRFSTIPVYMLSALRTIERVDKSLELGARNYYSKPNQITDYKAILKDMIGTSDYAAEKISA